MAAAPGLPPAYTVDPMTNISSACAGQNAEVEQAVDPALGYVYEEWMGCQDIAFARSIDELTFSHPIAVPGSVGFEPECVGSGRHGRARQHRIRRFHARQRGIRSWPCRSTMGSRSRRSPRCFRLTKKLGRSRLYRRWTRRHGLRNLGLRAGAHFGHLPLQCFRQLRLCHRRFKRSAAEIDRRRQNFRPDGVRQSGVSCERWRQRSPGGGIERANRLAVPGIPDHQPNDFFHESRVQLFHFVLRPRRHPGRRPSV
jgi:hypothetical protein